MGSANYVFLDAKRRLWVAVASRRQPPHASIHVEPDGYIALAGTDDHFGIHFMLNAVIRVFDLDAQVTCSRYRIEFMQNEYHFAVKGFAG